MASGIKFSYLNRIIVTGIGLLCVFFGNSVELRADPVSLAGSPISNSAFSEAKVYLRKQKWTEASGLLRGLQKQFPNNLPIIIGLSTALAHLGERAEAVSILVEAANQVNVMERRFLLRKAHVLSRQFLTNRSFEAFQEGMSAFSAKRYRQAREKFERVLVDEPNHFDILIKLGQCLILENDMSLGIERFKQAKKANPSDPESALWLGRAYFLAGKPGDAVNELKSMYPDLKEFELASVWLAEAQAASGQTAFALKTLDLDVKVHPMHLNSLLTGARIRFQSPRSADREGIWAARKDLQLAVSRMDGYEPESGPDCEAAFAFQKTKEEIKGDIQKLLQQIQARIDETSQKE